MLASLKIENVAVIEKAEVNFTPGFNVLTGETGAGKSILIDSINAILGNRTSRELVRSGAQKACIWATFESIPASVKKQHCIWGCWISMPRTAICSPSITAATASWSRSSGSWMP